MSTCPRVLPSVDFSNLRSMAIAHLITAHLLIDLLAYQQEVIFCHASVLTPFVLSNACCQNKGHNQCCLDRRCTSGEKPKDSESETAPEPSRKQAASEAKQSGKVKSTRRRDEGIQAEEDEDSLMADAQEPSRKMLQCPVWQLQCESDKEELPEYQVYEEVVDNDNDDDLAALRDEDSGALSAVLAEETDEDDDDKLPSPSDPRLMQIHSSGRSSTSSGHFSVPSSSNADTDSDDDPETKAMFSSLQHAQETVPVPHKKSAKPAAAAPVKSTTQASKTSHPSAPSCSKREVACDQEWPTWNKSTTVTMQPKAHQSAPQVKLEEVAHPVPSLQPVKIKKEVTRDTTVIAAHDIIKIDDDDEEPQAYDADICIIVTDRKVGLKNQNTHVAKVGQLGIDYYLGFYVFIHSFPDGIQKTAFSRDALLNAAHALNHADIIAMLSNPTNTDYIDLFSTLLHRVCSSTNCKERVKFLMEAIGYIYPLCVGNDIPDIEKVYTTPGITSALRHFFKGSPSLVDKYSELFTTGPSSKKQVPQSMVALGGMAISIYHSLLPFLTDKWQEIYKMHILVLEQIREKSLQRYQALLGDLFMSLFLFWDRREPGKSIQLVLVRGNDARIKWEELFPIDVYFPDGFFRMYLLFSDFKDRQEEVRFIDRMEDLSLSVFVWPPAQQSLFYRKKLQLAGHLDTICKASHSYKLSANLHSGRSSAIYGVYYVSFMEKQNGEVGFDYFMNEVELGGNGVCLFSAYSQAAEMVMDELFGAILACYRNCLEVLVPQPVVHVKALAAPQPYPSPPEPKTKRARKPHSCGNCGKVGHDMRICPLV
ncbi:hypothetical protein C8J57DRAFT_1253669 [Mycena rebaudengoi]|nr:hypothetical protein C8J57DRAFT_1253669 [Mycena rebaudengoi]